MAILNTLLVHGNGRILNKLYVNDLDVSGTSNFSAISATSLTSTGTLSVTGASTLTGAVTAGSTISATGNITSSGSVTGANLYATTAIHVNNKKALSYSGNNLYVNDGNAFSSGTYIKNTLTTDTFVGTTATIGTL